MKKNILSEIHLSTRWIHAMNQISLSVAHVVPSKLQKKVFKRRISRKMKGAADILIDLACIQLFSLYHDLDHKNSLDFTESMSRDVKKNRYQIVRDKYRGYVHSISIYAKQETYTRRNGPMPHTSFSAGTSRLIRKRHCLPQNLHSEHTKICILYRA